MAYLLGTDEAGYGPNLGPLVIAASLWRVPSSRRPSDLYDLLADVVRSETGTDRLGSERLVIADSKRLYHPGGGLEQLERGVLTMLGASRPLPTTWPALWSDLSPDGDRPWEATPEAVQYEGPVPCAVSSPDLERSIARLQPGLAAVGVELCAIRAEVLFPARFNDLVERQGGKGSLLSHATLKLVRDLITPLPDDAVLISCDKHGGRNRYGELLQNLFPDHLVEVWGEGRASSRYRWGPASRRVEIEFTAKGERFLPAALASMTAKYLRERAMEALNHFWCTRIPGLRPTAGYPVDARRFFQETETVRAELGISDHVVWRVR